MPTRSPPRRREAHALERAVDAVVRLAIACGRVDVEVLGAREVRVEAGLLDDRPDAGEGGGAAAREVVAEQADVPGRRLREAEEHADERRLARAVRPEEPERVPARDLEVDRLEGRPLTEALAEPVGLDGEGGGHGETFAVAGRAVVGRRDRPTGVSHTFG